MPVSLKDQVVLIIGASSGIGRATAVLFAQDGAKVMAAARRAERLEQLKTDLSGQGLAIETGTVDAGNEEETQKLVAETEARLGPIDVLVYATGTNTPDRALTRLTPPIWHELVQVNLNGAFYATYSVLPSMRERRAGHLIYVASISGLVPDVSGAAYQASKRGMLGLAHAIRVEERQNGIRTCVICPGLVDTELIAKRPVQPTADTLAQALQPEDVADAIFAVAKLPARAAVPELQIMPTTL